MTVEILFGEVCSLYGDSQNITYLKQTLPEATFIETKLVDEPWFLRNDPDLILIGTMSENVQRRVIEKFRPHKARILELIEKGTPILATGNACEIFCKQIEYVTEKISFAGLGIVDLTVKTDYFKRYNRKVLGEAAGIKIVGFRSQFSFLYGDNSGNYFQKVLRGDGINRESKLEGFRVKNLIGTQLLGPMLPLNPLFCEYLLGLAGCDAKAAFRDEAMMAYEQRVKEFSDPEVKFDPI